MKTKLAFRHNKDEIKGPYRYTACGLDNVYLLNGYELYQLEDGEGVSVQRLGGFTSCYWALSGKARRAAPTQGTPLVPFASGLDPRQTGRDFSMHA